MNKKTSKTSSQEVFENGVFATTVGGGGGQLLICKFTTFGLDILKR